MNWRTTLSWFLSVATVALIAFSCGCGTPRGYDADLTPDHNGEQWIGGALQHYPPEARAAMRAHLQRETWCAWCQSTNDLEVHHVIPVVNRPDLAASDRNMISLCHRCHRYVAHPGGDSRKWIMNLRELCQKRLLCGPGTDAP